MSDSHFISSIDSPNELEQLLFNFDHAKDFFKHVSEKYKNGENIEEQLDSAIGFLEFSIEKIDKQFPEVWCSVVSNHPSTFEDDD